MAKVRVRIGENEIEVDSRDFYVDNQSLGQVLEEFSGHIRAHSARIVGGFDVVPDGRGAEPGLEYLGSLDDAEVHEPEFSGPVPIPAREIKSKLEILENDSFFEKPRTVSETVGQLREYGWITGNLEVSKTLTQMALQKELTKDSGDGRYSSAKERLLTS